MCLNDAYLILVLFDQYVGNWNNSATHISSVAIHIVMVDMHRKRMLKGQEVSMIMGNRYGMGMISTNVEGDGWYHHKQIRIALAASNHPPPPNP